MFHKDNCVINSQSTGHKAQSNKEELEMTAYKILEKLVDVGDFI